MSQCDFEDDWEDFTPSLQDQLFENLQHVEMAAAAAHAAASEQLDNTNNSQEQQLAPMISLEELESSQKENTPNESSQHSFHKVKSNLDTIILPRVDSLDDDAIWGGDFDIDMLSSIQNKTEINTAKALGESYSIEAPEEQDALLQELSAQLSTQQNIGFVTARGKEIPKPSKKALAKAKSLFQDLPPIDAVESSDDNDKQNQPMNKSTNHNDELLAAIMGEDDDKFPFSITSQQVINDQQVNQEQQSYSVGFVTGCGKEIKPPSKEALEKAKSLLDDHSLAAAIPQPKGDLAMTNDIHENDDTGKQETLDHTDNEDAQLKLGAKRPANTPLAIKDHNSTTTGSEQRKKLKTNKDNDESSLDSTVPSTATSTPHLSSKEQQPHKPLQKNHHDKPLKDILKSTGSRTSRVRTGGGLFSQVKPFKSPIIPSLVDRTKAAVDSKRTATANEPVFDLSVPEHRYPLKELGPPGAYSRAQLTAMMVDPQVMDMTFKNATTYTPTPITQVRATLMEKGCKNVNIKWVTHHHAMIVWKLACLTRSYPDKMKHVLNQDEIIRQLLYRYEREINRGHRPVIKKILQQDDIAAKHMVLAISEIIPIKSPQINESPKYSLRLTDGWYHILTTVDPRMSRAIEKKRLKVGHKLSICGARLTDQSEPISPLDQLDEEGACKLIISSNSCMPVSWDTKLGIQKRALVCRPIHSLFDDGGMVTMLDVTLCRKYPMMYMEVLPNKQNVHRTAREEEELVYGNRMPNFKAEKSIEAKTNQVDERRVSGYFKIKVCDSKGASSGFANILISNANEVIYMDLKEGARYRVSFLLPRPQKYNQQLQLKTINTMTRWEPLKMPSHTTAYIPRSLTLASAIKESSSNGYEIDIVACVLNANAPTHDTSFGRQRYHQTVLVTDQSLGLCQIHLRTQQPLKELDGQVIGLLNLKYESHDSKFDISCLKMTDESELIYKALSSIAFMNKGLMDLKNWVVSHKSQVRSVRERLNHILQ